MLELGIIEIPKNYNFPRKATHSVHGKVIVHGFFQVGSLEFGCDPQAVIELLPSGKIEIASVDNLIMEEV